MATPTQYTAYANQEKQYQPDYQMQYNTAPPAQNMYPQQSPQNMYPQQTPSPQPNFHQQQYPPQPAQFQQQPYQQSYQANHFQSPQPTGNTAYGTTAVTGVPHEPSPRAKKILGLLYTSMVLAVLVFALSMVHLGILSAFLAPAMAILTLIFTITLIVLTHLDFKKMRAGKFVDERGQARIIAIGRLPSVICGFLLLPPWIGALGLIATVVSAVGAITSYSSYSSSSDSYGGLYRRARSRGGSSFGTGSSSSSYYGYTRGAIDQVIAIGATEAACCGIQLVIMLTFLILAILERKAIIKSRTTAPAEVGKQGFA